MTSLPGQTQLNLTTVPQQVQIVSGGSTLINADTVPIILSTDAIPTPANSFTLNGKASLPLMSGPIWASVAQKGQTGLLWVVPYIGNYYDPNIAVVTQVAGRLKKSLNVGTVQTLILPIPPAGSAWALNRFLVDQGTGVLVGAFSGFLYSIVTSTIISDDMNGLIAAEQLNAAALAGTANCYLSYDQVPVNA